MKATYDRLRNPPQGVVSTRKATFGDIGTIETPDAAHRRLQDEGVNAAMLEHFASPWNCIYAAKDLAADPNAPKTKINGTGPFTFVEHVKGSHVSGKKNDGLFQEGPALSRRLQGRVHAAGGRHAQRGAGRPGAGRVPRHLAGRARPAGAGAWATRSASRN